MNCLEMLDEMRQKVGSRITRGLDDVAIFDFAQSDPRLGQAIEEAWRAFRDISQIRTDIRELSEEEFIHRLQDGYQNFYSQDTLSPFVPLAARGPWIVTLHGAVVFDMGGYGMLGFGHNPAQILESLCQPQVMANIMTPSLAHEQFMTRLRREIGHARPADKRNPYEAFFCLNSGSEAMSLALRLADAHAKELLDQHGSNRQIRVLAMQGSFHGRTNGPAQISNSCIGTYRKYLASFQNEKLGLTVPPNDEAALERVFRESRERGELISAMVVEPVMGEGDPGRAITRSFYDTARRLTREYGALLIVDSVQAGFRAAGTLSIVDYPGFETCEPPDVEAFSKALNAGQYPLSLLAVGPLAHSRYRIGLYGNTMTSNPRALSVASAVLDAMTPAIRENIRKSGALLVQKFQDMARRNGSGVRKVQGTGLIVSVELNDDCCKASGADSMEQAVRRLGVNVIHGGENSLRFTPHFLLTEKEIDLIVTVVEQAINNVCAQTSTCCRRANLPVRPPVPVKEHPSFARK